MRNETTGMSSQTNRYCSHLDVLVPRVEDYVGRHEVRLFHLMVVALLEQGEPLSIEAIAARLMAAGAWAPSGDMVHSLKKAWHGMEPVYRDSDGRMGLNLSSSELRILSFRLGLTQSKFHPVSLPPEPDPEPLPDDVPLTENEIRWALRGKSSSSVSEVRQAAAALDACGEPMSVEEVEAYLCRVTLDRPWRRPPDMRRWDKSGVYTGADGKLWLDRAAPVVPAMRRAIRKLGRPAQLQEAREEHWKLVRQAQEPELARRRQEERQAAARLRRAVLRVVPDAGPAVAAALVDVAAHTVRSFVGEELAELRRALESFDLVAALWVRDALGTLGVPDPDRFRLVDLKPPQKTRRLNRQGRTLAITPELLITSTTGISRPLGDSAKTAGYLAEGSEGKLRRRIESDAKALLAFYQYGLLHGYVRLRWGFLDESLSVDWAAPGDLLLYEILGSCHTAGTPVDLVWGSAPGWSNPWSRARRVKIDSVDFGSIVVSSEEESWHLDRNEIQAIRPVVPPASDHLSSTTGPP